MDNEIGSTEILSDYVPQILYLDLKMVFQNPTEALTYLIENPIDLLITEIVMSRLLGIDLYSAIRTETNT